MYNSPVDNVMWLMTEVKSGDKYATDVEFPPSTSCSQSCCQRWPRHTVVSSDLHSSRTINTALESQISLLVMKQFFLHLPVQTKTHNNQHRRIQKHIFLTLTIWNIVEVQLVETKTRLRLPSTNWQVQLAQLDSCVAFPTYDWCAHTNDFFLLSRSDQ